MSDPYTDPSSTYITVVNSKLNMKQDFERLNHDIVSCNVRFQPNTSTIIVYDVIRYTYLFKVYKTMHAFHISITLVSMLFINTATVLIMLLYRTLYNIYFTCNATDSACNCMAFL